MKICTIVEKVLLKILVIQSELGTKFWSPTLTRQIMAWASVVMLLSSCRELFVAVQFSEIQRILSH